MAYDLTRRVNAKGGFLGLLLQYKLDQSGLDARDRSLVAELSYGIQRHRNKLDYIIGSFSNRPLERIEPEVLYLLRLGVYQISEMRIPAHASVNETMDLAKKCLHHGGSSFVNAVLRNTPVGLENLSWPSRDDFPHYLEIIYSHPRWLIDYLLAYMDEDEVEAFCAANNSITGFTLRVNLSRIERESLLSEIEKHHGRARLSLNLEEALIDVHLVRGQVRNFLEEGYCVVQDESSIVVGRVVQPHPGNTIVDACAAPGGKATHLAQLGGKSCRVVAMDINPRRLNALRNVVDRLGLRNIEILEGDATRLKDYMDVPADAILVDAPCSGLGTLRRRPELKWRRYPHELPHMAKVQSALLEGCADRVVPGGTLVYSVCTFTHEETLDVLNTFLDRHPDYRQIGRAHV